MKPDFGPSKGLANAVCRLDRIAVQDRNVESSRVAAGHERLMQVRQACHNRTACSSTTHYQHAHLPFKQFRVDAVSLHGQLLNARFRAR